MVGAREGYQVLITRLQEELYGRPEVAVPALCLCAGVFTFAVTRSAKMALAASVTTLGAWNHVSKKLVINDQRLGKIELVCPPRSPRERKQVWLTFDDGPGPETIGIVKLLNRFKFRATFFFIGEQVKKFCQLEELVLVLEQGQHSVANHSLTHPNFLKLTTQQARLEIEKNQAVLLRMFPDFVTPLFRPPFGYRNQQTLSNAKELGLSVVGWNLNTLDFLRGKPERVCQRIEKQLQPGAILLFHDGRDGRERTLHALPRILTWLAENDYEGYSPR